MRPLVLSLALLLPFAVACGQRAPVGSAPDPIASTAVAASPSDSATPAPSASPTPEVSASPALTISPTAQPTSSATMKSFLVDGTVWNAEGCAVMPCFDRPVPGVTVLAQPDGVRAVTDAEGRFALRVTGAVNEYRCVTLEVWQDGIRRFRVSELRLFVSPSMVAHWTPGLYATPRDETYTARWASSAPCPGR